MPYNLRIKSHYHLLLVILTIFSGTSCINAQILHDTLAVTMIKSGISSMYNLEFTKANEICARIEHIYPDHPGNPMFKAYHIKNFLLLKEFDHAEYVINSFRRYSVNRYYDAQVLIFNGILQEKKYMNYSLAKEFYENGINNISSFGSYGNEFCAYGYLGLSRISDYYGDKTGKKSYQRKGFDLVDFKKVNFN